MVHPAPQTKFLSENRFFSLGHYHFLAFGTPPLFFSESVFNVANKRFNCRQHSQSVIEGLEAPSAEARAERACRLFNMPSLMLKQALSMLSIVPLPWPKLFPPLRQNACILRHFFFQIWVKFNDIPKACDCLLLTDGLFSCTQILHGQKLLLISHGFRLILHRSLKRHHLN